VEFDVPGWLATLTGVPRQEVVYSDETESDGLMTVTYSRGGERLAVVDLVAVPLSSSRRAAWQVLAQLKDRLERAQVPATTRFIWR
jgi:hypothetical protein